MSSKDQLLLEQAYDLVREQLYTFNGIKYSAPPTTGDEEKEIFYSVALEAVSKDTTLMSELQTLNSQPNNPSAYKAFWEKVRKQVLQNVRMEKKYSEQTIQDVLDNDVLWNTLTEYLVSQVRDKQMAAAPKGSLDKYDQNAEANFNDVKHNPNNPNKVSFFQYIQNLSVSDDPNAQQ